ncbi:MAG: hypothetical protein ABSF82_00615 [Candidatus Bathyarchaeia archaeon]
MTDVTSIMIGIVGIIGTAIVGWLGYAAYEKPKSTNSDQDVYIDDFTLRRIQVLKCALNWGTRLFPYQRLKLYEPPLNADILIQYTPPGGIETDLADDHFEVITSRKRKVKTIKLKDKGFFKQESINEVTLTIQTPIERSLYANKVTRKLVGEILWVSNENSEEMRNFRLDLARPVRLSKLSVVDGTISAIAIEMPYSTIGSLLSKRLDEIEHDVVMTLVMNLPPHKGGKRDGQIGIKMGDQSALLKTKQ